MKNRIKILIAITAVILSGAAIYWFLIQKDSIEFTMNTFTAETGSIQSTVSTTGTVEPILQVEVGTQVSAEVKKVYVDFNSSVKKGQLIAELDKTNLKTAVINAQANYNKSISEKEFLQSSFNRQKELFDNKMISELEYEESLYKLETITNTVIERLSNLNTAKTNLGFANIYSPIDGVILSRDVDEGQTVAASLSSPTLFTIAQDLKQMQVEAAVDEADIGLVKEGQRVTFYVDAYTDQEFSGMVTQVRLNPTVNSNVVTYTVIIKADNPELKLMPGLTATVTIFIYESNNLITLETKAVNFSPKDGLLRAYNHQSKDGGRPPRPKGKRPPKGEKSPPKAAHLENVVWVLKDGKIHPQQVTLGKSDGIHIEILNGIEVGDEVVYELSVKQEQPMKSRSGGSSPFMQKPPGRK
jgi:HlyD family secretion protein